MSTNRPDTMPPALSSELVALAARLLRLRTFLNDDPHDDELRSIAVRLRDLADEPAVRASVAVRGDGSPTPDEEAAQGREDGSAAESGPPVYLVETLGGRWGPEFDDLADARIYAEYCRETYGETRIVRVTREVIQ